MRSGTRLGLYEIGRLLGAGGMGEVYRARDCRLDREVAIKVLPAAVTADPERLARFEREARLLASLNHPHIASLYGLEEGGGTPALVMELVEGPTLAERLAHGPLPLDECISTLLQIAEALEHAHDKGIIHRDLKPANVKLTAEGAVKVLDFGLAKALEVHAPVPASDLTHSPTLTYGPTAAGVILGTAGYMAPEQAKGKPVDKRADIWAFGVLMFECLSGRRLFQAETPAETIGLILTRAPDLSTLPAATPPRLRDLLRRCLVADPKHRLRDIGDARLVLEEPGAAEERAAGEGVAAGIAPRRTKRETLAWAAFAVAALTALVLAFALARRSPPPAESLRTSIELPAGYRLQRGAAIAFSPDGRQLALALANELGQRAQLFLRALDSPEVKPLAGTEDAGSPFWSPDGSSIGFFASGRLKRIDLANGLVRTLCQAPVGWGGAWSPRGVIVFAPRGRGGLQQVAATGGTPTTLTAPATGGSHRFPEFLPDGRRFLYLSKHNENREDDGVFVFDLETRKTRRIRHQPALARYAAPGHLAWIEEGTLMAQPFDAGDLKTTGDAAPIAERVEWSPRTAAQYNFSFSAQGLLAYREAWLPPAQLTWYDEGGRKLETIGEPERYASVSLSPDGRHALVTIAGEGGKGGLWILDLGRGLRSRLTQEIVEVFPRWSPDGKRIAYVASSGGSARRLVIADAGGGAVLRTLPATYFRSLSWLPDGKALLLGMYRRESRQEDLVTLPLTGKPQPLLGGPADEHSGEISPDGKWLLYISDESGRGEAYVTSFPGLRGKWPITSRGIASRPVLWLSRAEIGNVDLDGRLSIIPVTSRGEELEIGAPLPKPGFGDLLARAPSGWSTASRRVLVAVPVEEPRRARLELVQNWAAALKR